jgi:hypothetical protein
MCVALERARRASAAGDGPWTVGVRDPRGELLASAMLDSYAQLKAFTQAMEELGFTPSAREAGESCGSCDFSFTLREEQASAAGRDLITA